MFCKNCGKEIHDNAVICIHCGCSVDDEKSSIQQKDLSMVAYILLAFFFCAHRLYAGQKYGILYFILGIIAWLTVWTGFGIIFSIAWLVIEIIDISNAVRTHMISDTDGNIKTI